MNKIYHKIRTSIVKGSSIYGMSLDKRHSIFDTNRFINDPWPGSSEKGKDSLNTPISDYSFSWIRDLNAIGGNSIRKYVRNAVLNFILEYKKTKRFWKLDSWQLEVTSERIVNWILSYSFFATGSDNKLQKIVLSSLAEQFSHISRLYKTEDNSFIKLRAIKAIIFCLCVMNNNNKSKIIKVLNELEKTVANNFDKTGLFITRNPEAHFDTFRNLLEIRFIIRTHSIVFPFNELLSIIAMHVRFFRLGDGKLSSHSGNRLEKALLYNDNPSPNIIDSALSFVNSPIQQQDINTYGFSKLANKHIVIILNNRISNAKSRFVPSKEQGINIFDFEATIKTDRIIKVADISILSKNKYRIKANENSLPYIQQNNHFIECEITNLDKQFQFAFRREIEIQSKIVVSDCIYTSEYSEIFIRCVTNEKSVLEQIGNHSVIINLNGNKYRFFQLNSDTTNTMLILNKHTINIYFKNLTNKENKIDWIIEAL